MRINQKDFKPVPESFHAKVQDAVREGASRQTKTYRRPIPYKRIAIATAFLVAVLITSVFGYSTAREHPLSFEQPKKHVVQPIVNDSEDAAESPDPEFVKLTYSVPEGYVISPNSGEKYHNEANEEKRISIGGLKRPTDGKIEPVKNVTATHEITVNGKDALLFEYGTGTTGKDFNRIAYLYFSDVNIYFSAYFTIAVTEEELMSLLESVNVTESTAEDSSFYSVYDPDAVTSFSDGSIRKDGLKWCRVTQTPMGTEMNVRTDIVGKVEDIAVVESLSDVDPSRFTVTEDGWQKSLNTYFDETGKPLDRKSEVWNNKGEGVLGEDYLPQYMGSEEHEQVLILARITYTNTSDTIQTYGLDPFVKILVPGSDGELYYSDARDGDKNFNPDGLQPVYLEGAEEIENYEIDWREYPPVVFYIGTLKAGETITVTTGWLCDKELIDDAYLSFYQIYTSNALPYYATKVTEYAS